MDDHETEDGDAKPGKAFVDFPFSIRLAQRSILIAIAIPIVLRTLLRAGVPRLRLIVVCAAAVCGAVGLIATYYAVIRYPYMGLVDAADGDLFSKYIEARPKWMMVFVKIAGLIGTVAAVVVPFTDGQLSDAEVWMVLYALSLLGFFIFLSFFYSREDYPTVATFLRCSMGMGIFVYPIFIPALLLGSMRGRMLLDNATAQIEADRRRTY